MPPSAACLADGKARDPQYGKGIGHSADELLTRRLGQEAPVARQEFFSAKQLVDIVASKTCYGFFALEKEGTEARPDECSSGGISNLNLNAGFG